MQPINRDFFYNTYRDSFNEHLTQEQVDGLNELLGFLEGDNDIIDPRHAAYMLATVKHECANTYKPIKEYSNGEQYEGRRDLGNVNPGDGVKFKGRGYTMITGRYNYEHFGTLFGLPLTDEPDDVLTPKIAYEIMSYGMRYGVFTGKKLSDYINDAECDYLNARKIINSLDKADLIAGYAKVFEQALSNTTV